MSYIKQLEEQNEELKQALAESQDEIEKLSAMKCFVPQWIYADKYHNLVLFNAIYGTVQEIQKSNGILYLAKPNPPISAPLDIQIDALITADLDDAKKHIVSFYQMLTEKMNE